MISLVTVTQGNPKALRRTVDNVVHAFGGLVNDVVVGDVSVYDDNFTTGFDDVRFLKMPFDHLFRLGFGHVLNDVAGQAKNDLCLYLNVGEVVDCNLNTSLISDEWNAYTFNHAVDPHKWTRVWNRRQLEWSGRIHEEIGVGNKRECPKHLFMMADTEKDMDDDFRAGVYNDIKEIIYFYQYVYLADNPHDHGGTNKHWVNYAIQEQVDLRRRLEAKGDRYRAFKEADLELYRRTAEAERPDKVWSKP